MAIQNAVSNQFLTTTSTPAFVNVINGFTSTATAAGTTVLTATSTGIQEFTGSTTQTVTMPVVSTLPRTGVQYYIVNNSSGVVTVQSSGANTIQAMDANTSLLLTCILATGTTAASWNATYFADSGLAGAVLLNPTGNQTINGAFNLIMATGSMVAPTMLPGNLSLTGNTISSTNSNGDIDFIPNGNGTPIFGATTPYMANSSSVFFANIMGVAKQTGLAVAVYNSGGTVLPGFQTLCSRGATIGSFGAVNNGDIVGQYIAEATDGSAIQNVGRIRFFVSGAVSSGIIPGGFQIRTTNLSGVETTAVTVDQAQVMSLANPLPAGSGGTGITSLGTGVATALGQNVNGTGAIPLIATGSFTPAFTFATPGDQSIGYTGTPIGYYTRIGNQVTVQIQIVVTATYTTASGNALITGLPFASNANNRSAGVWSQKSTAMTYPGTSTQIFPYIDVSTTTINMYSIGSGSGFVSLGVAEFPTTVSRVVYFNITYFV